ncbi:glycosyl hydrolase catalytic core-domain-containing protein [Xylaria castorea]|nr:glycosyl hydrolase catalytic core-domain-containing protein [Xylaria castorea]
MYSKTSLMALCAAAAVKEVAAGHGHQHLHADKRDVVYASTETVIQTDYVTVTVTYGQEPTVASATTSTKVHRPHHSHSTQQSSAAVTTSDSSSVVVAETSSSVAVPTVTPTTMMTTVKPTTSVVSSVSTTSVVQQTTTTIPTTTSAATSATTSAAPTSTPVSSGGKCGLAYNDASLVQEFLTLGGQASWAYNWGSYPGTLPQGVTYYPMLWSPASDHSNGWDAAAKDAISKGADALLGFNEPDIASQANMSPQAAAAAHIQWMNPYAGQARISTPAISSSENANQGIDWLKQFFTACNGQCKFDFCVAHWYGPGDATGAEQFLSHLKDVNTACDGKPVWVTEFAAESGSVDDFMSTIVSKLETSEYSFVEKYSYFMAGVGELFTSSTSLSTYGKIYAGLS